MVAHEWVQRPWTIFVVLVVLLSALPATAQVFETFDVPGAQVTAPRGINDSGQIIGGFSPDGDSTRVFLLSGGVFTTIDVPGIPGIEVSDSFGINDSGQIVGLLRGAQAGHGFLLSGGVFTTIDVPGARSTVATGINDSGQIVGYFTDAQFLQHGFLLSGGVFTTIDVPGAPATQALGINDSGQIVGLFVNAQGVHGFLLSEGVFTTIDVPGAFGSRARGINDSGQIVGFFDDAQGFHGFLLSGGVFTKIDVPAAMHTLAFGITDSGQIVGQFADAQGNHGFLRSGCNVSVTRLGQCGPDPSTQEPLASWAEEQYDHHPPGLRGPDDTGSICRWGCYLTALSMALKSEGVPQVPRCEEIFPFGKKQTVCSESELVANDPGSLNRFNNSRNIWSSSFRVNPVGTTLALGIRLSKQLIFMPKTIDSLEDEDGAKKFLDDTLCAGHAVIVGVSRPTCEKFPCHFVLVYAKDGDNYLIADPAARSINPFDPSPKETRLLDGVYGTRFVTRGFVQDPLDRSALVLFGGSNIDFLLTHPSGKRTGLDPSTMQELDEVPGSARAVDSISDLESEIPGETTHSIHAVQIQPGVYTVTAIGLTAGLYSLEIRAYSEDGSEQPVIEMPGVTAAGSTTTFEIQFSPSPGSRAHVSRIATFESTKDDIQNAFRLGLIDNRGIVRSLSSKIEAAENAVSRGNTDAAKDILKAFINQVAAQSEKHITGVAPQVLREDADSLLANMR